MAERVSITDFSSYATPITGGKNWTEALKKAVVALDTLVPSPLIKSGIIDFPYGEYYLDSVVIPMGVVLLGKAPGISNMANPHTRSNGSIIVPINKTGACLTFDGGHLKGFGGGMFNLRFQGGMGAGTNAVVLDDVFEFTMSGNVFEHLDVDNAILAHSTTGKLCNRIKLRDNNFKLIGSRNGGSYGRGNGINFLSCSDSEVLDCFVEDCGDVGIILGGGENKVRGGFVDLNNVGIYMGGKNNGVYGTSCKLNHKSGLSITGTGSYVGAGAKFIDNNRSATAEYGIKVEAAAKNICISDVEVASGTTPEGGVHAGSILLYSSGITGVIQNSRLRDTKKIVDPHSLSSGQVSVINV